MIQAHRLQTRLVEKIWGRDRLPAPFETPPGKRIGEIWFEPPSQLPDLLVKYLFTSEKLSVQVHPSEEHACPGEAGKEECWPVLDADPDAKLAIGLASECDPAMVERAARDGTIENLLEWHSAKPGDLFYLPAGTVHAIGPGISLLELQQASDTTFRLYDYGRDRELHLKRAMAVAHCGPYDAEHRSNVGARGECLIDGPFFRLDRVEGMPSKSILAAYPDALLALPLAGNVSANGGAAKAGPGECLYVDGIDALDFSAADITLLTRSKR